MLMTKNGFNYVKQLHTGTDTTFTFTATGWNDWADLQIDHWLCLIGMLQSR